MKLEWRQGNKLMAAWLGHEYDSEMCLDGIGEPLGIVETNPILRCYVWQVYSPDGRGGIVSDGFAMELATAKAECEQSILTLWAPPGDTVER